MGQSKMNDAQNVRGRLQIAENVALREFFFHHDPCRTAHKCWTWPRYRDEKGYGCITYDGFKFPVHRLSFEHYKGIIPAGFVVMHDCDNPPCFNPDHLFLGTQQENVRDMMRKGRHSSQSRRIRGPEDMPNGWVWNNPPLHNELLTDEQMAQRKKLADWLREVQNHKRFA